MQCFLVVPESYCRTLVAHCFSVSQSTREVPPVDLGVSHQSLNLLHSYLNMDLIQCWPLSRTSSYLDAVRLRLTTMSDTDLLNPDSPSAIPSPLPSSALVTSARVRSSVPSSPLVRLDLRISGEATKFQKSESEDSAPERFSYKPLCKSRPSSRRKLPTQLKFGATGRSHTCSEDTNSIRVVRDYRRSSLTEVSRLFDDAT